jgi:prepilin-type N-terminal cleavage/methylation domain-containing protein
MKKIKSYKAFTLVELTIVVAIIAILIALIIPATQKALGSARKAKAMTAMKQIAEAYALYYQDNGSIPTADSSAELAEKFAAAGSFNNANLFVFPGDAGAAALEREEIWPLDSNKHAWESGGNLSVCLVGNIPSGVSMDAMPVAYTRGLQTSGLWNADGVYGAEGGFIAFLDGQVRWYTKLDASTEQLSYATTTGVTSNISSVITGAGASTLAVAVPAATKYAV